MVPDQEPDPSGRSKDPTIPPLLFLVVLGGRVPGVHIELHDVRFVVGRTLDDTLPALRRQWFGPRRGLHIDSWLMVRQVDRFAVHLSREPWEGVDRLWFVNLGGYRPQRLGEEHAFGLVVAATVTAAKRQAMASWLPGAVERHKDDVHPVACLDGWHVHLRPVDSPPPPLAPDWFGYRPI